MRLLLDTHTFLWFLLEDPQLRTTVSDVITDPTRLTVFAALGYGVLGTAMVEPVAYCLETVGRKEPSGRSPIVV